MNYSRELNRVMSRLKDETDLRFEQATLDLLFPEDAPHTPVQAYESLARKHKEALVEGFRELGKGLGEAFSLIKRTAQGVTGVYSARGEGLESTKHS